MVIKSTAWFSTPVAMLLPVTCSSMAFKSREYIFTGGHTYSYFISFRNRTAKGAEDGGGFDLDGGVTHSEIAFCLSYENEGSGFGQGLLSLFAPL